MFTDEQCKEAINQNDTLQNRLDEIIIKLQQQKCDKETEKCYDEINKTTIDHGMTWQKSCMNVCKILTTHVEELAEFLDTLLNKRSGLRNIGADQREAIRDAVDRSLDLSRSILSLSIMDQSSMDQSLIYFNSLNDILENSHCDSINKILDESKRRYSSSTPFVSVQQMLRGCSNNKTLTVTTTNTTESETWSEPDKNVSQARIGIDIDSNSGGGGCVGSVSCTKSVQSTTSDDTEDDEQTSTRELIRIKSILKKRDTSLIIAENTIKDIDRERLKFIGIAKNLKDLLKTRKLSHEQTLKELDEKTRTIGDLQRDRELIKINLRIAETKLDTLRGDYDELKVKHEKDIERLRNQLTEMEIIKMEFEEKYENGLRDNLIEIKQKLAEEWVTRNIYEQQENELHDVRRCYNESQQRLDDYERTNEILQKRLINYEQNVRKLQKSLDESTIQSSKIVLERTKALNERSHVECELKQLQDELQTITNEKIYLNQRVVQLEEEKSRVLTNKNENILLTQSPVVYGAVGSVVVDHHHHHNNKIGVAEVRHDCQKIDKDYSELKIKLMKTRKALEETWSKLKASNQRKEQIERNIRQQVVQTQTVLSNVRNIMEQKSVVVGSGEEKENHN